MMRRLFSFILFLFVIVGAVIAGLIYFDIDLPFDIPFLSGRGERTITLPTHTPPPQPTEVVSGVEPSPEPPPITSSDGCVVENAAEGVVAAQAARSVRPQVALPNNAPRNADVLNRGQQRKQSQNQVIIRFTEDSRPNERNAYLRQINGRIAPGARPQLNKLNLAVVNLPPGTSTDSFPDSPIVEYIEVDSVAGAMQVTPNDTRFAEQWAPSAIGLPGVWASLPDNAEQVTVAVLDSGICASHPELQGRIVAGYDFIDDDSTPQDNFGHGCSVAGVIAASSNNAAGIAGVAPNAMIMPVRVLDDVGLGNYSDIAEGIIWAADNDADIINLSLAGPDPSAALADAVAYAINRGVTVIAATGNYGLDTVWYPAAFPGVIAVGSVDSNLQRSSFSNHSDRVDMLAPGRDILTLSADGDYIFMSGTSFAAPHVAGLEALALALGGALNTENGIVYLYPPETDLEC